MKSGTPPCYPIATMSRVHLLAMPTMLPIKLAWSETVGAAKADRRLQPCENCARIGADAGQDFGCAAARNPCLRAELCDALVRRSIPRPGVSQRHRIGPGVCSAALRNRLDYQYRSKDEVHRQ